MTEHSETRKISILTSYLHPKTYGAFFNEIHSELRATLKNIEMNAQIGKMLISLGDPEFIPPVLQYLDQIGSDADEDQFTPFNCITFENVRSDHRFPTFRLLHAHQSCPNIAIQKRIMTGILRTGDTALLQHVVTSFPQVDLFDVMEKFDWNAELEDHHADIMVSVMTSICTNQDACETLLDRAFRTQAPRPVAMLMKLGMNAASTLDKLQMPGSPWPMRLKARMASNHSALALLSTLPALEVIATMSNQDLRMMLAGPTAKEMKAARKIEKRTSGLAKKAAYDTRHEKVTKFDN
jgi:hypothetical protein